jgi:LysM repeat protein
MYTHNKKGYSMKAVYVRRRVVVALLLIAMGYLAVDKTASLVKEDDAFCIVPQVKVNPNDTLWGIVRTHCPDQHYRTGDVVLQVIEMNGNPSIYPNQVIYLPVKKGNK